MKGHRRKSHLYGAKKMSFILQRAVFPRISLLLFLCMVDGIASKASIVTSIDLTTNYTPLNKAVGNASAAATRHAELKLMKPSSSSSLSSTIANRLNSNLTNSRQQQHQHQQQQQQKHQDQQKQQPQQHNLMAVPSKSYVTQVSGNTSQPIALKRTDMKLKKPITSFILNGSTEVQKKNSKTKVESLDHVPDSSGHIPYRIGHPHSLISAPTPLPPPQLPYIQADYDTTGDSPPTSKGHSIPYHGSPYDAEKWHAEYWERDNNKKIHFNNTKVHHIEAECQDDYMKIRIGFNGSFNGLVYSAGYAYDPDCIYINGTGRDYYEFYIQLNRCGTLGKNSLHDDNIKNPTNFMWNTVTVQYNPLIEEEYDEHFKVTCEYGYDFWKTVTFPFLDVEVATGNPVVFTLSPPECYMEIQNGYGIGGPRVIGPVRVGDPLTLIIYMRSKYDGFDIVVNDCYAHNGANKRIQLIDQYGCPVDDKLISRFRGSWSDTGIFETQVYAYMKTFRFTGSPALYIECDVRMCHGRCPSQPCHWRNLKAVTKREIGFNLSNTTPTLEIEHFLDLTERPTVIALSENVSLFQSLRVLKDGEIDENYYDDQQEQHQRQNLQSNIINQTCFKTVTFSAIITTLCMLLCISFAILFITCSHIKRQRKKPSSIYDFYITHKGQID